MSCRKHIFGFGVLATMAVTAPAYAQSGSGSTVNIAADYPVCTKTIDSDIARQKYIAARQDYEEGSYDSALRRFKDSYANDCTKPEVLLIVSATYERKGDRPSALAALETYVQRAGSNAPDMATTQAKIENLKKQIASQPPPTATTTQTTTTAQPAADDAQGHTIYPWILVGVGAAAVVVGVIVIATAPAAPDAKYDCDSSTLMCAPNTPASITSQAGRHYHQPIWGGVTIAGGGVLIAGGLIWHFLEPTGATKEKSAHITPAVSPTFAGLTFDTKF